jgi:acyl-homoserine lactone acylase PvdQ
MRPGNGIGSLIGIMTARDADALILALERHHEPVVSVIYADDSGVAGTQLAGWLPQRILPTSLVPVPGRLRLFNWREPIDFEALPATRIDASRDGGGVGKGRSWLAVADGRLGEEQMAGGIEWLWRTGERQRRLEASLAELTSAKSPLVDLRAAAALQNDVTGSLAKELIPSLLRLAQSGGPLRPEAREIAQLLGRWDAGMEASSRGAVAYQVLMEHLIEGLFRRPFGDPLFARYMTLPGVRPASVVSSLVRAADRHGDRGGWSDRQLISTAIRSGLRKAWVSLSYRLGPSRDRWRWGRLHELAFQPFAEFGTTRSRAFELGRVGPSTALVRFEVGGDETTLSSTDFLRMRSYATTSSASYRFAVDLAAPDRMLSSLAPGQSEHILHPHADDGTKRWLEGRPALLLTSRLLVEEESGGRLLLEPSR